MAGGWEKKAVLALVQSLVAGSRQASALLFAWGFSPTLGVVISKEVKTSSTPRVVLLFGWGGSTPEQLEPLRQWWEDFGCSTVTVTRSTQDIDVQVATIISFIPEGASVLVHAFSNNGMYLLYDLQRSLEHHIHGIVVDSAPDNSLSIPLLRQVANGCVRALCALHGVVLDEAAEQALSSINVLTPLQEGDRLTWEYTGPCGSSSAVLGSDGRRRGWLVAPNVGAHLHREAFERDIGEMADRPLSAAEVAGLVEFQVIEVAFPDLDGMLRKFNGAQEPKAPPVLFLYSHADTLIKARAVEEYMQSSAEKGQASAVCFEGSHHVRHFQKHRERYTAELDKFTSIVGF